MMARWLMVLALVAGIASHASAVTNEWGAPVVPDRMVIVTIDGIRADWADTMLARLDDSLVAFGAAYFPGFRTGYDGLTDPRHAAMVTGYHETLDSCCCNGTGAKPDHQTIGSLLVSDLGLGPYSALFVTAKDHLSATLEETGGLVLYVDLGTTEGPDSLAWHVFRDTLAAYHPAFAVLELARFDKRAHVWTTFGYYDGLSAIADQAVDVVLGVYRWLAADGYYAGRTLLAVLPDHGRHCNGVPGFGTKPWTSHGHGPCGTELCLCCDDIWLYLCAPGDTTAWLDAGTHTRSYQIESLGATAKLIFGLPVTCEQLPITEWSR